MFKVAVYQNVSKLCENYKL